MQYLVAHILKGAVVNYHRMLSDAIAKKRKLIPVTDRVDPHITLKAPFQAEDITVIERIVGVFAAKERGRPFTLEGFDHFDGRVLFMSALAPKQTHMLIRRLQDKLRAVPWLTFNRHEFPLILHATLAYPKTPEQCKEILHDLRKNNERFECALDSVAILRKADSRWETITQYPLLR